MMNAPFVRSPYNYDTDEASNQSGLFCDPADNLTAQEFAADADINVIARRFGLTGQVMAPPVLPQSGDFTGVSDFHTAMNLVRGAEQGFLKLPASLRSRFGNNPGELLAFLDDPGNRDEAIRLGLVAAPPEVDRGGAQLPLPSVPAVPAPVPAAPAASAPSAAP